MDGYNYTAYGQCDLNAPDFRAVAQVGAKAPDFVLTHLDGGKISLKEFLGQKHLLLEFGSIT